MELFIQIKDSMKLVPLWQITDNGGKLFIKIKKANKNNNMPENRILFIRKLLTFVFLIYPEY